MAKKQPSADTTVTTVTWGDQPHEINNKYGVWRQGEPRTGFTPEALAELSATPGFIVAVVPAEDAPLPSVADVPLLPAALPSEALSVVAAPIVEPASVTKENS